MLALIVLTVSCLDFAYWDLVGGNAHSIAITNTVAWIANRQVQITGGYQLSSYSYTSQTWTTGTLGCVQVALSTLNLYCVQADGTVIKVTNQGFGAPTTLSFKASDLKANTFGYVCYVSQTTTTGGYTVYQYDESIGSSTLISGGGGVKISPTPDGYAWIVTDSQIIQKYDGSTWTTISGAAYDIVIGLDGIPVILSTTALFSGWIIQRYVPSISSWFSLITLEALKFALDGSNQVYLITSVYDIFRWKGTTSNMCPGTLLAILDV